MIENVMGALLQVLVIFEMQRKLSNEKITREISFQIYETHVFCFWTPLTLKLHNLFISYSC